MVSGLDSIECSTATRYESQNGVSSWLLGVIGGIRN